MEPKTVPAPKVVQLTAHELAQMDQRIAVGVFGFRWYRFPAQRAIEGQRPKVAAFSSLQKPAKWLERHEAKPIDCPVPGDELDIDIPPYHKDEDFVVELSAACVARYPEHPLALSQCLDGGYCYGDIQKEHYPTIPMALCAYTIRLFKLESLRTYHNPQP